jgi:hypothetical protein
MSDSCAQLIDIRDQCHFRCPAPLKPAPPSARQLMALGFAGLGFLGYRKTGSDNALA